MHWVCEFEAQPENGLIICHRERNGEVERNYTSYTRTGIHPSLPDLDPASLASWHAAVLVMNW